MGPGAAVVFAVVVLEKIRSKILDVSPPLAKRRQMQVHDVNTIEKNLAKSAGFGFFLQPAICGADYAHFNFLVFLSADAAQLPILKQLQQFRLKRKIQFGNLIEKKTAAMGQFDASRFRAVGACEGAFFISEELTFEQSAWDGGAMDFYEGAGAPGSARVDHAGDDVRAGPAGWDSVFTKENQLSFDWRAEVAGDSREDERIS